MVLNGPTGQLEVYPHKITITRKGFRAKLKVGFTRGERDIFYRQIGSVHFKRGGMMNGFIQFATTGGIEQKGGYLKQWESENSVEF